MSYYNVNKCLEMLGYQVQDKVSGFKGVADSICFDLYGCVQVVVRPPATKDNKIDDCRIFDFHRLDIKSKKPVMDQPSFVSLAQVSKPEPKGPADKPGYLKG